MVVALRDIGQDDVFAAQPFEIVKELGDLGIRAGELRNFLSGCAQLVEIGICDPEFALHLLPPSLREIGIEDDQALLAATDGELHGRKEPQIEIRVGLPALLDRPPDVGHHDHFVMICQRDRPQASGDALINKGLCPLGTGSLDILSCRRRTRLTDGLAEAHGPWARPVRVPWRVDLEVTLSPVSEAQDRLRVSRVT